jgi:hypothetical protein
VGIHHADERRFAMRCADLTAIWADLADWLERRDVIVLPPLVAHLPMVRLDANTGAAADATAVATGRLRQLIDHFGVRAVYVERCDALPMERDAVPELAALTVRVLIAGAVHELRLYASWYGALLDSDIGLEAGMAAAPSS